MDVNAGIEINITVGNLKINRCAYLEINSTHGSIIDTASFIAADTDNEIFNSIKKDDNVKIEFGYADGLLSSFTGVVQHIQAYYNRNATKITAVHSSKKLCSTYINESYNDETSLNIIKRLVQSANVEIGEINIPDITIPHIVFNNKSVFQAIKQVYATLEHLLNKDLSGEDFFVIGGKFYAGDVKIKGGSIKIETGINIIRHDFVNEGYAEIECSLEPSFTAGMPFNLNDTRHNITGSFLADYVRHTIDKGKARTLVGYYYVN